MNIADDAPALVEAILFLEVEPVADATIAAIAGVSREAVLEAISELQRRYDESASGLEIVDIAGGFLLSPKVSMWPRLRRRYGQKNDTNLSRAAIETLSIVAYSQPITKSEIENIRGVGAEGMLRLLLSKDLIRVVGKGDSFGKPALFGTTAAFLKSFRLASIADLPKLDDVNQERFELDGS